MLKKICYSFSILFPLTFSLFCSRFDDTTGLGKDIIRDIDPSLTDVSQNFKTVETISIDSAFSIPNQNDTYFGVHPGALSVGTKENVSASGYLEYTFNSEIWSRFSLTEKDSCTFNIDSIYIQCDILNKKSSLPSNINVYAATNEDKYRRTTQVKQIHIATLSLNKDSSSYSGPVFDSSLIDSIVTAFNSFRDQMLDCGKNDSCKNLIKDEVFRFCLFSDDTCNLAHLSSSPKMKFIARKDLDTLRVITTPASINFVAIENNSEILSNQPLSSFASQRIAVFKLDISNIWEMMDSTKFDEMLSAAFTITPKSYKNMFSENKSDTLMVVYYLSDKLIDNDSTFKKQRVSNVQKIITSDTTEKTDTLHLKNLDKHFQLLTTNKPSSVYLYLQLSNRYDLHWKEVLWNNPKFKAILTTLE